MDGNTETSTGTNGSNGAIIGKNAEAVEALANIETPLARMKEFNFSFRKKVEEVKDDQGNVIEKKELKRAAFKLQLPVPTFEGLRAALKDEKGQNYILDLLEDQVYEAALVQVNDDLSPVNSQQQFDLSKVTLNYLVNQPKSDRRGGGIPKEVWEEFAKDWITVMPSTAGKTVEQATNAAKILTGRLQMVKSNKKVLKNLEDQLQLWFTNSSRQEEFAEVYEFLNNKAQEFLAADDSKLLDNI